MKCSYCGKELPMEATKCDGCGASIANTTQQNANSEPVQQFNNYQQPKSNNKSGLLIVILFIAIAAVLSYFLLFSGSSDDNNENTNVANTENVDDNVIIKSKKNAYVEMAKTYMASVRNMVNEGRDIRFYTTNALLLLPVGDTTRCGNLEAGGSSPFGKEWNYAYVGVVYDGKGYNYYFISEDNQIYGIPFTAFEKLVDYQSVYKDHNGIITDEISSKLTELYNVSEDVTYDVESIGELKDILTTSDMSVDKYIFVSTTEGCTYPKR